MQQAHNFKRNLFTLKIVGNTFSTHRFFPNAFLSPPQKMPERLLGVLCKHLSQWIFPRCRSFLTRRARAHSSFISPLSWQRCVPVTSMRWLLPTPAPRSRGLLLPRAPIPVSFHTHRSVEEGHKEGCCTEINLHAAISKSLRFVKNAPLEAEIHQGVVDGCQRPTVPTALQHQHHHPGHQRCTGMRENSRSS